MLFEMGFMGRTDIAGSPNYGQLIKDIRIYRTHGYEHLSRRVYSEIKYVGDAEEYKDYVVGISERLGRRFDELHEEELHQTIDFLVINSEYDISGLRLPLTKKQKIDRIVSFVSPI